MKALKTRICPICNREFNLRSPNERQRFCSKACAYKDPERRKQSSITMRKTNIKRRQILQKRMIENNPSHNPEVLAKARATKKKNGTLHKFMGPRGGNGMLTKPQIILSAALQWPTEIAVSLGSPRTKGYPSNYKIDIANVDIKMGIEVDGHGHRCEKAKNRDKKKENKLMELGWTILRFTNEEILENLNIVLSRVESAIMVDT